MIYNFFVQIYILSDKHLILGTEYWFWDKWSNCGHGFL